VSPPQKALAPAEVGPTAHFLVENADPHSEGLQKVYISSFFQEALVLSFYDLCHTNKNKTDLIIKKMRIKSFLIESVPEAFVPFFPFGWLMGLTFLAVWPAFFFLKLSHYPGLFHALGMVSLFIGSFAIGFLLTALPRFTGTYPAKNIEIIFLLLLSIFELLSLLLFKAEWATFFAASKFLYIFFFAFSRARHASLQPPPSFIWLLFGFFSIIVGGFGYSIASLGYFPSEFFTLFKSLIYRGFLISLFMGVGGRLIPFLTSMPSLNARNHIPKFHIFAAFLFFGGLLTEPFVSQNAIILRVSLFCQFFSIFLSVGFLWALYQKPGSEFRSIALWISSWLLVLGQGVCMFWPQYSIHLFHISFIGGFAAGTMMIASHVVVSHKNLNKKFLSRFFPLGLIWGFLILASITRASAHLTHYTSHLIYAAVTAIIALLIWAGSLLFFFRQI
jgi:uncharacterized protein involved in response to NO